MSLGWATRADYRGTLSPCQTLSAAKGDSTGAALSC